MKTKTALLLTTLSLFAFAACKQSDQPMPKQSAASTKQIARGGETRDDSLGNRENRAGEMGDTQREQNLENRQENSDARQGTRVD